MRPSLLAMGRGAVADISKMPMNAAFVFYRQRNANRSRQLRSRFFSSFIEGAIPALNLLPELPLSTGLNHSGCLAYFMQPGDGALMRAKFARLGFIE
jgi:hypothetical protein